MSCCPALIGLLFARTQKKEKKKKNNKLLSQRKPKINNKVRRLKTIMLQTEQMVFQGTTKTCFSSQVRSSLICCNLFVL